MSDSPQYEAFRAFAQAHIDLAVLKATEPLKEEIRSLRTTLETRSAPQGIAGPPGPKGDAGERGADGKNGVDGKDGAPGTNGKDGAIGERGVDGLNGKDGAPSTVPGPKGDTGERGADGIATREEIEEVVERQVRGLQFRNLIDYHRGTYERGASYKTSDIAVWDGGTWIAATDTTAVPGTSADWKQFAKKGRDGRDRTDRGPYSK